MLNVALTGNIAAGKSAVADLFRRWGATIIDADQLVREVQAPGSPVLAAIATRFGEEILLPDGSLNRPRLRTMVMTDIVARRDLEAIVHPAVEARSAQRREEARRRGDRLVVSEIPLLFEALDPAAFDAVVLVDAPESLRAERLMRERGLAAGEVRDLLAAQLPATDKRRWRGGPRHEGPFIIDNDGDREQLERRARAVWQELMARAGA
ncbi:MAG TPA: dephospho-CoA kinase [Gemmatimonadales bacterium]|jgi:dephospho-CoA kinase